MPAQDRAQEPTEEDNPQKENHDDPQGLYGSDSSSEENKDDEYVVIPLADIRKEVQCPICLGIIRKTRTVMECLHRFCRECIDKSMRLGNNECPACRTHCASRRSLRDDPNYDALIAAIYPNIDKYEEEETALYEEEKDSNKQLQDSIAKTLKRQSEALGKKGTRAKAKSTASMKGSQSNLSRARMKRRKNYHRDEPLGSHDKDNEEGVNGVNNSSSAEEYCTELGPGRGKRRTGDQFSHPSGAGASGVGGCSESDSEVDRECIGTTPAFFSGPERFTWGSSGLRSRVSNGKNARKSPNSNLINHLRNSEINNDELVICLILVPLDAHELPKLQQLHVCCRPTLSVSQLCQYVALQTALETNDIEILMVQGLQPNLKLSTFRSSSISETLNIDPTKLKIQVIQEQETLAGIQATCKLTHGPLILAYQKKLQSSSH